MLRSKNIAQYVIALLAFAAAGGCSNPIAPASPTDIVRISGPKIGQLKKPYSFVAAVNFSPQVKIYYQWTIDDTAFDTPATFDSSSQVPWFFHHLGTHAIQVKVFRTGDYKLLCSAVDSFTVVSFFLSISPDSTHSISNFPTSFKANANPSLPKGAYTLIWYFDTAKIERVNVDTASFIFHNAGIHTVKAIYLDSTQVVQSSTSTIDLVSNLVLSITSNTNSPSVLAPVIFTLLHNGFTLPEKYLVHWIFDSTLLDRHNTDTTSFVFASMGSHTIKAVIEDSSDKMIDTCSTSIQVNGIQFHINPSSNQATTLLPLSFNPHVGQVPTGSALIWKFGDGIQTDTSIMAISHVFRFTGALTVKAFLINGANLIAADSTIINVAPLLENFNTTTLLSFQRAVAIFAGSTQKSGMADCYPGGGIFSADSLSWTGLTASWSISNSESSKSQFQQNSSYSKANFIASFTNGGMVLDTVKSSEGEGSSMQYLGPNGDYSSVEDTWSGLVGYSLPIIYFTPDSAEYGVANAPGTSVTFNGGCDNIIYPDHVGVSGKIQTIGIYPAPVTVTFYRR